MQTSPESPKLPITKDFILYQIKPCSRFRRIEIYFFLKTSFVTFFYLLNHYLQVFFNHTIIIMQQIIVQFWTR